MEWTVDFSSFGVEKVAYEDLGKHGYFLFEIQGAKYELNFIKDHDLFTLVVLDVLHKEKRCPLCQKMNLTCVKSETCLPLMMNHKETLKRLTNAPNVRLRWIMREKKG